MNDNNSLHINSKTHEMRLSVLPFSQIARGEKVYEVRLLDEKRRALSVGDEILFRERGTDASLRARIRALLPFSSFRDAFAALPLPKLGFPEGADPALMYAYYTPKEEAKWGVLVIEISLL